MTQKHHSYMRLASQIRTPTSTRIANARPHVNLFESVFSVTVTAPMCAILSKNLLCQFRAAFARNATTVPPPSPFFSTCYSFQFFCGPSKKRILRSGIVWVCVCLCSNYVQAIIADLRDISWNILSFPLDAANRREHENNLKRYGSQFGFGL